jgi:hypothetical protein
MMGFFKEDVMAISQNTAQELLKGAVTRFWQVRGAQTGK